MIYATSNSMDRQVFPGADNGCRYSRMIACAAAGTNHKTAADFE